MSKDSTSDDSETCKFSPINAFGEMAGFGVIREMLVAGCRNGISVAMAESIIFLSDRDTLLPLLQEADEYMQLLTTGDGYPDAVIHDHRQVLEGIKTPGSWFEPEWLPELHTSLKGIFSYREYFSGNSDYPQLATIVEAIVADESILASTGGLLDDEGNIRDDATEELSRIRGSIVSLQQKSERLMRRILKEAVSAGIVPKETGYTVKNGRYVIPVPAARKRQLRGYVHDESGTGQTLYIEPGEVMELFNEIRELELAERREVIRIMTLLADRLRPQIPDLSESYLIAGRLDFIRAKGRLAIQTGGIKPEISPSPGLHWRRAVHPVLALTLRQQEREVVPLDITLDLAGRILIISGPNAGGKSVCLKTAGLLQYMLQCGLLIPVDSGSVSGLFTKMFIDIGDQQSIENDLSTYSSHLLNIKTLLEHADSETLFLIDEMGSGTEPVSGGAIAEAALEKLASSGAFGIVTTHYSNLKLLAGHLPGVVNGAMLFDTESMQPLYRLRMGKPGSSFAFEIASRIGIPEDILQRARELTGVAHYDYDIQIQQLEVEKEHLEKRSRELHVADAFVAEMIEKYTRLYEQLDSRRKEIIGTAQAEAKQIVAASNRIIEKTIREIRESEADKDAVKRARIELADQAAKLSEPEITSLKEPGKTAAMEVVRKKKLSSDITGPPASDQHPVTVGDWVCIDGHTKAGQIVSLDDKKVSVAFGSVKMQVSITKVKRTPSPQPISVSQPIRTTVISDLHSRSALFNSSTDVRGLRAAEAIREVTRLIDEALLLNYKALQILHGKGDGILRQVIRQHLASMPEVLKFHDEHIERGGHGITLVHLK
jgi:DNA mismatch repair protein MutS2